MFIFIQQKNHLIYPADYWLIFAIGMCLGKMPKSFEFPMLIQHSHGGFREDVISEIRLINLLFGAA